MISKTEIKNFNKKFDVVSVFVEHDGKILLLHRQTHKPQGNTWGIVAGKVDQSENFLDAITRETEEEIGLKIKSEDLKYFERYYVRYSEYDFTYHVYHLSLKEKPDINLNFNEHKDYLWVNPKDALELELIQDEDSCIKWFYNIN